MTAMCFMKREQKPTECRINGIKVSMLNLADNSTDQISR